MSKFVDKLHKLTKPSAPAIGFHVAASKSKNPPMLFVAGLSGVDTAEVTNAVRSNADAGLILNSSFKPGNLKKTIAAMGDIPLGVLIRGITEKRVSKLINSGCDFVVFDMQTSSAVLREEKTGKFLLVEPSLDQGLVNAINNLDIDGVFINKGEDPFITVKHLVVCHRFSKLLNKPLIVVLPSPITSVEIANLWKASIAGIVAPTTQPVDTFAELKEAINSLAEQTKRRRDKANAVLPQYREHISAEEEEEEEEEI